MTRLARPLASAAVAITLLMISFPVHAAQGRAVSLKMLEKVLKDGTLKQALTLCGVTRPSGFIVDPKSKDVILLGKVDPSYPSLQVDDFVVALRAANRLYARREGNVRYYTSPGCSIDPDPRTIQQLRQVKGASGSGDKDRQAVSIKWEAIGRQPQQVRVLGVPFDTHFAKVMVDADYYMKSLSNGSVDLEIPGFTSIMSMRAEETRAEFRSGIESSEPQSSMNRFWFCPGETTYEEGDGLVTLRECRVKLLTEEEFLTTRGEVKGLGKPSAYGGRFANAFTTHYQAIAESKPIYRELESLFRLSAIASLMRDTKATSRSGNKLAYLLSGYKVKNVAVSRTLPGRTRVIELTDERETRSGTLTSYVTLMSCGGVDMDVRPKKVAAAAPVRSGGVTKPRATSLSKVVLASRKSPSAVYWDFPVTD